MNDQATRKAVLDLICFVPVEGPADERYFHDDIASMSEMDRLRECERARHRLLLDPKPHPWLLERIDRLREALDHVH